MNVYDQAHSLAKAIQESNEFIQFDTLRKEIENDETVSSMIKDLHNIQMQMQASQFSGQELNQEMVTQLQSLSTMIATKPLAAQYLQAEAAFITMFGDVNKILIDATGIR